MTAFEEAASDVDSTSAIFTFDIGIANQSPVDKTLNEILAMVLFVDVSEYDGGYFRL